MKFIYELYFLSLLIFFLSQVEAVRRKQIEFKLYLAEREKEKDFKLVELYKKQAEEWSKELEEAKVLEKVKRENYVEELKKL